MVESTRTVGEERVVSFIATPLLYLKNGFDDRPAGGAGRDSAAVEPMRSESPLRGESRIPTAGISTRMEGGIGLLSFPVPLAGARGGFAVVLEVCIARADVLDRLGGGVGLAATVGGLGCSAGNDSLEQRCARCCADSRPGA